jgi:hypothetical protein
MMYSKETTIKKGLISGLVAGSGALMAAQAVDASEIEQVASTLGATLFAALVRMAINWVKNRHG